MPLKLYAATSDQFSHTYFALSWSYTGGVWQPQVVEYDRFTNPPNGQNPTTTTMSRIGIVFPNIQSLLVNMPNANNNLLPQIFAIDGSGLPHGIDMTNLPELQVPLSSSGIWTKGGAFWIVGMLGLNSVVTPITWAVYRSTDFNPVTGIGTWVEQDPSHRARVPIYAYWDGSANDISFLISDPISGALFLQEFDTTTNLYTARHDQIPGGLTASTVGNTLIRPSPDGGTWLLYGQPLNSPGGSAVDVRAIKLTGGTWGTDTKISTNISGAVDAGAIPNTLIVDSNNAAHIWYGFQQTGGPGNSAFAQYYRRMNADASLTGVTTVGGVASQTPFGSLGNGVVDSGFIIDGSTNTPDPGGDTLIVGAFYSNDGLTNSQQPGVVRGTPLSAPSFTLQTATWVPPDNNSRLTNVFLTNSIEESLETDSHIVLGESFSITLPSPPGPGRGVPPCGGNPTPQPLTDVQFELRRVYCTMRPHTRIPVRGG